MSRPGVAPGSAAAAIRDELDLVCAWCSRVFVDGTWRPDVWLEDRRLTHGICPDCLASLDPRNAPQVAA